MKSLICIISIFSFVATDQYTDEWKKVFCQNKLEVSEGIRTCFDMKDREVKEAITNCLSEAFQSSNDDVVDISKAACEDEALFSKVSECHRNNDFSKKEGNEESLACFRDLFTKYGLKELADIYKNY